MIDCIFTGDIMPGARRVDEVPDPGLLGHFKEADLVVGNLECPIVSEPPAVMDTRKCLCGRTRATCRYSRALVLPM